MKIGTLTFHASHNYGSVLQAYALAKQLDVMGNDVSVINLRLQAQKDVFRKKPEMKRLRNKIFYFSFQVLL